MKLNVRWSLQATASLPPQAILMTYSQYNLSLFNELLFVTMWLSAASTPKVIKLFCTYLLRHIKIQFTQIINLKCDLVFLLFGYQVFDCKIFYIVAQLFF